MFVLTAVSSRNTSRAGSSRPCSRIQHRRARATSARCCSAARRLFFKGDVMTVKEPPERAPTASDSPLAQCREDFTQCEIRLFVDKGQYHGRVLSSRDVLPPRGFGAELPLSCQRCNHLTAVLAATSKASAAARRDTPHTTVSITRSRKSPE